MPLDLAFQLLCLVAMVVAVGRLWGRFSQPARIFCVGLGIIFLSTLLTPGIYFGELGSSLLMSAISDIVFVVGFGVIVWAAVAWRRSRSRSQDRATDPS